MAATAAATAVFELLELEEWVPNKVVYIIAPTYDQVKDIYFPLLAYSLGLEKFTIKPPSRDLGRFFFKKNVELRLISYEAIERMRGKGAYFVVWDEISSCKAGISSKEAWEAIIQPCILTRWSPMRAKLYGSPNIGRALIITTPKGYNFFYDMYNYQDVDKQWGSFHFDYLASPLLDPTEIERIRHTIDPIEFASEYLASFKESGNNLFYCFDRDIHVQNIIPDFEKDERILAAIDFNVGLQCTSFWAERGKEMHCIDEMKGHPDTEQLGIAMKAKYPNHKIVAYPDPSGRARKTSAPVGVTDFTILQGMGIHTVARKKAPPIVDSVQAVNRHLMTAAGGVHTYIHPRAQGTIHSLERTIWLDKNPDTAAIDKTAGDEHYSDGIRYLFEHKFPIRHGKKVVSRGFNF
jgi:hypothetical protein